MSAPAQKALPAPVSTMTRAASSAAAAQTAAWTASHRGWVIAFASSGRFSVSTATPSVVRVVTRSGASDPAMLVSLSRILS